MFVIDIIIVKIVKKFQILDLLRTVSESTSVGSLRHPQLSPGPEDQGFHLPAEVSVRERVREK